jgi:hypothetical protein
VRISYLVVEERSGVPVAEGYTVHPFTTRDGKVVKTPRFFIEVFGETESQT